MRVLKPNWSGEGRGVGGEVTPRRDGLVTGRVDFWSTEQFCKRKQDKGVVSNVSYFTFKTYRVFVIRVCMRGVPSVYRLLFGHVRVRK